VFGGVPALILLIGWLFTSRPTINRNLVAGLLLVGGIAVLAPASSAPAWAHATSRSTTRKGAWGSPTDDRARIGPGGGDG